MPMPRKYSTKDAPVVGAAVEFLNALADAMAAGYYEASAVSVECRHQADALYEYMARNLHRRGAGRTETERKARNLTITMRGYQKRIAELEEKLLLIRTSTDLMERGLRTSDAGSGGQTVRMKRRIDHLEAKLLIIRELTDTNVGKRGDAEIPEKERQIHDARIRVDVEKGLNGRRGIINRAKGELLKKVVAQ